MRRVLLAAVYFPVHAVLAAIGLVALAPAGDRFRWLAPAARTTAALFALAAVAALLTL